MLVSCQLFIVLQAVWARSRGASSRHGTSTLAALRCSTESRGRTLGLRATAPMVPKVVLAALALAVSPAHARAAKLHNILMITVDGEELSLSLSLSLPSRALSCARSLCLSRSVARALSLPLAPLLGPACRATETRPCASQTCVLSSTSPTA